MTDKQKFSPSPRLTKTLVICLLALLTACAEEDPKKFVQEGTALFDKGDMDGARVQFRNALQANPKLAEAYYGLALLDEKNTDWVAMKKNLQEVIALDPNHSDAHAKLGLLIISDLAKAKEQAAISSKLDANNLIAILLQAQINFKEGNKVEALNLIDRVLAKDAAYTDALSLKAEILMADKRHDEALTVLDQGLIAQPDSLQLGRLKVKVHFDQRKIGEVVADYQELVAKHPDRKELLSEFTGLLIQFGRLDQAEQILRDAIERNPADLQLKLVLVDLVGMTDAGQAESVLKDFIALHPKEVALKQRLAGYFLKHKRYQDAKSVFQGVIESDPSGKDGLAAKVSLAEIALTENDSSNADRLVREVLTVDAGNSNALLFRAQRRLAQREFDDAISDLRIVLRDQPNSDGAMVLMAQVYAMKGESEVAQSYWRKALEVSPANLTAIVPLTTEFLKRQDAAGAEELLTKSLKAKPNDPAVLELLARVRTIRKDWVGAEAVAAELRKIPERFVDGQMLSGMLQVNQGHYLEALQIFKGVVAEKPDMGEAFVALAKAYDAAGHHPELVRFLSEFITDHPRSISAYHTLALAHAADKKWGDANKALEDALKVDPKMVATYALFAGVLVQQGKSVDVPDLFRKGMNAMPDNPELMMALARFYEHAKQFDKAIASYNNLLDKHPNNDEAANNLAYLLAEYGGSMDSINRSVTVAERFKDSPNPFFMDTYGWALLKSGNTNAAIDVFKNTVARVPTNSEFRYHLGEAYFAAGDKTAAQQELEKSLSAAGKQNEFAGIDRAKELLKQLAG